MADSLLKENFEIEFSLFKFMVESDISTQQQIQSYLKYLIDTFVDEDLGKEIKREWRRYLKDNNKAVDMNGEEDNENDDDDWGDDEEPEKPAKKTKSKEESKVIKVNRKAKTK